MLLSYCKRELASLANQQDRGQAAQDIVQSVYQDVLRTGDISQAESPLAYLLAAVRYALIAEAERRKRDPLSQACPERSSTLDQFPAEMEEEDREQLFAALDIAIERMSERLRPFIEMNRHGMSARQIGNRLGIEEWRARRRLTEAKQELERLFHEAQGLSPK